MNGISIFDNFILDENIQQMEAESKTRIASFLTNDKVVYIQHCIIHSLRNNTNSVGLEVEGIYHTARIKYYEDERLELSKVEFSWGLSNYLLGIGEYRYKLKNFQDVGWIVLDLCGRSIEDPYNSDGVSWVFRFDENFEE